MLHPKYWPHYFSYHLNREVEEVYWHTFLSNLALSLVFIFEPIYLYSLGFSLVKIMWFYAQVYIWYAILIFLGAKFASRFGYKHAIFISTIFYVFYWLILFSISYYPILFFVAPVLFALQKSFLWPAYDADVALASVKIQRGREVGLLFALIQFAFILGPFLGGFISERFGFLMLFVSAAFLMLFSAYPLFKTAEIYPRHQFKFRNLLTMFQNHRSNFFGYWGYAEDLMVMSLWPIYMFIVIPDFFGVGLIGTIATVIGTMLMLYVGKLSDRYDKRKLTQFGSIVYAATWVFRFLAKGFYGILTFDVLTKTGKDLTSVPMLALTYERGGNKGPDQAIAYSVFFEFSLSIGKIVTALAAIAILSTTGNIFLAFALTGILTMFYGLLK